MMQIMEQPHMFTSHLIKLSEAASMRQIQFNIEWQKNVGASIRHNKGGSLR